MKDLEQQLALIKRGVVELIDEDELKKKLERGTPLRVKVGFDPTPLFFRKCGISSSWGILSFF